MIELLSARIWTSSARSSGKSWGCWLSTTALSSHAHRQPYVIRRREEKPFVFAGIWRSDPDRPTTECLIIVQSAGDALRQIHNRQPLRLEPDAWETWLSTQPVDPAKIAQLLASPPTNDWSVVPVSSHVNHVASDDPRCIAPSEAGWPRPRR